MRVCWPSPQLDCLLRARPQDKAKAHIAGQVIPPGWQVGIDYAFGADTVFEIGEVVALNRSDGSTKFGQQPRPVARPLELVRPAALVAPPTDAECPRLVAESSAPGTPGNRADDGVPHARMHALRDGKWHAILRVRVHVCAHLYVPRGEAVDPQPETGGGPRVDAARAIACGRAQICGPCSR